MIKKVAQFIHIHSLIPPNIKTVFAAVSGGMDSCVLLDILSELQTELDYNLKMLHFNHGVRGKDGDADEAFVRELAARYGLNLVTGRISGRPQSTNETYLREHRMAFFMSTLQKNMASLIATGHHSDDSVETFLMRMARGSRLQGLLSIRPRRGSFIRPLLTLDRREIKKYAGNKGLDYCEDKTNRDVSVIRNRIRHRVLPYMRKELDAAIDQNILKSIRDLALYNELFEEKLKETILLSTKKTKHGISLHRKRYLSCNKAIRRGLMEYCISTVYPLNYKVSERNLSIWDDFIRDAGPGKKRNFLESGIALAERHYILFGDIPGEKKEKYRLVPGSPLIIDNMYKITLSHASKEDVTFSTNKNIEYIDAEKSGSKLAVRFWQKGDSFKPLGMKNRRKLSDFFIDLKLSTILKREVPIVTADNRIIWVSGYRIDDYFKVSAETKKVLKLELEVLN